MDNPAYRIEEDFYKPETRWDFYISEKRKKVWAKELEILLVFDSICKKHGLRYRLDGGTLLGAVRHGGFVPWDDDLDVDMTRTEYERARRIMKEELPYPFEWQDLYTNLSICTPEQITSTHMLPFAKIRNRETTAIEPPAMPVEINQGIWMDIFIFDEGYDGQGITPEVLQMEKELYVATFGVQRLKDKLVSPDYASAVPKEDLKTILQLPVIERFKIYEETLLSLAGQSTKYAYQYLEVLKDTPGFSKTYHDEIIEMPFEGFPMPVPAGYHEFLTEWFGDYSVPYVRSEHKVIFNPDVPYTDYFEHPDRYIDNLSLGCDD